MTNAELESLLRNEDVYRTRQPYPRSMTDRMLGWADLWYYAELYRIVRQARKQALKGEFDREVWRGCALDTLRLVERCGGRLAIEGTSRLLELRGPAVIAANHMSLLETFILPGIVLCSRDAATVVKEALLEHSLFGPVMRATEPIAVSRQNPRQDLKQVIEQGTIMLKEGRSVIIFPQSTRLRTFSPEKFNTLGAKLARHAGVPLVSAAVKTDFMGVGRIFRDMGRIDRSQTVHVRIGEPALIEGTGKEQHQAAVDFICSSLLEWGGTVATEGVEA